MIASNRAEIFPSTRSKEASFSSLRALADLADAIDFSESTIAVEIATLCVCAQSKSVTNPGNCNTISCFV